jgi:hypothetical protein
VKRVALGFLAALALALVLGAASHGFSSSLDGAPPPVDVAGAGGQPLALGKGRLESRVVELIVDEENGVVAVVIEIKNPGPAVANVPVGITLLDASGAEVGNNTAAGIDAILNHVPSLPAGATQLYVNDGLTFDATPASAKVEVGVGEQGKLLQLETVGAKLEQSIYGPAVRGSVRNVGKRQAENVLVEAVVRVGDKIVSAGSARVELVEPGGKGEFDIPLVGKPQGGKLTVWVPEVP